jgi:ABC-type nitrate/sulfonate/bicarbonate transport system substrate-binding protein
MNLKPRKRVIALSLTALAVIALAACGSSRASGTSGAASARGTTTIRYNTNEGSISPLELASELGYLPHVNLDPVGAVIGGPADIQSVATGQTDIGGAFNGSVAKLIAAGGKIKAVTGYYGSNAVTNQGLYALPGSPIHTAKDLIGKKVAVNTLGANAEALIDLWLAKQGLTPAQVKQVELVVVPPVNEAAALRHGQVAAIEAGFQLVLFAEQEGPLRALFTDTQLIGPYTGGSLVLRDDFIAQHPAVVRELVAGVAKAVRFEQTAPVPTVIAAYEKFLAAHGRAAEEKFIAPWKSIGISVPGGYLRSADFQPWITWLVQTGQLESGQISPSQVYTDQFNPYAPQGGA